MKPSNQTLLFGNRRTISNSCYEILIFKILIHSYSHFIQTYPKNYWSTKLKKKLLGSTPNLNKRNHNQQQLQYQQLHQQQLHFPPLQLPQLSRAFDQFNSLASSTLLQSPSFLHYDAKPSLEDGNMIMFGSEKSCTSSDNMASLQGYLYNSGTGETQNLNIVKEGGGYGMSWGEQAPLEYNYEEIKQLMNYNYTPCNNPSKCNSRQ